MFFTASPGFHSIIGTCLCAAAWKTSAGRCSPNTWFMRSTSHTRIDAGLRLEHQRYDYDNRMLDGATREDGTPCGRPGAPVPCRYSRPADREDEFTEPALNLGLVQDIGGGQELVLSYAHGFRPPQSAELYRLQAGQLVADIDSEQVDNIEAGWRGTRETVSWQLAAYYMQCEAQGLPRPNVVVDWDGGVLAPR